MPIGSRLGLEEKSLEELVARRTVGRSLIIPAAINSISVQAIIDTAAMFTLVSRKLFQHIPDNCELVRVKGIGDQPITGQIATDTTITIGQISTSWDVCVIDMSDTVILGLDFLNACNAMDDLAHMTAMLNGQVIQATLEEGSKDQPTAQAFLARNIKVPPNTSMLLTVEVYSPPTDDYIIVPVCNGVPKYHGKWTTVCY